MCIIAYVSHDPPIEKIEYGWKVLRYSNHKLNFPYFVANKKIPVNKWLKSFSFQKEIIEHSDSGFHILKNRASARELCNRLNGINKTYKVFRVKYNHVITVGWDKGPAVVAKSMLILPNQYKR